LAPLIIVCAAAPSPSTLTAGRVEDDRLGALGAAVDAEEELSGGQQ
jgi:hypothetical protein